MYVVMTSGPVGLREKQVCSGIMPRDGMTDLHTVRLLRLF
jgi:hypothetical protein